MAKHESKSYSHREYEEAINQVKQSLAKTYISKRGEEAIRVWLELATRTNSNLHPGENKRLDTMLNTPPFALRPEYSSAESFDHIRPVVKELLQDSIASTYAKQLIRSVELGVSQTSFTLNPVSTEANDSVKFLALQTLYSNNHQDNAFSTIYNESQVGGQAMFLNLLSKPNIPLLLYPKSIAKTFIQQQLDGTLQQTFDSKIPGVRVRYTYSAEQTATLPTISLIIESPQKYWNSRR